jgi:hypothetical protein
MQTATAIKPEVSEQDAEIFLNCMEAAAIAMQDKRMFDAILDEMDLSDEEGKKMVEKLDQWLKEGGRG